VRETDVPGERNKYTVGLLVLSGVGAVLLQTTILHHLPFIPDLLLILCVYLGIYHRSVGGAAGAFFLGYGLDTCSGAPVGMNAFAMSLVFAVVASMARCLWLSNPLSVLFMVLLAVAIKTSAFLCLGEFGQLASLLRPMMAQYVMWDAAIALLLTPLVFTLLYRSEQFGYRT
jgi:rod shape-determining protein MreD